VAISNSFLSNYLKHFQNFPFGYYLYPVSILSERDVVYRSQPFSGIVVNGKTVTQSVNALAAIDTGTTLIGGPEADVVAIYNAIPGSKADANGGGIFVFRV
jgi:hypothetical protein